MMYVYKMMMGIGKVDGQNPRVELSKTRGYSFSESAAMFKGDVQGKFFDTVVEGAWNLLLGVVVVEADTIVVWKANFK